MNFSLPSSFEVIPIDQTVQKKYILYILLYKISNLYFKKNELDLALNYVNDCLDIENKNFHALFLKSKILAKQNLFDDSLHVLNTLIYYYPKNIDALFLEHLYIKCYYFLKFYFYSYL